MSTGTSRDPPWSPGLIVAAALVIAPHLAAADTPPAVSAWGLPELMASMHGVRTASARFVEQKFVQLLARPLQSSGTLIFNAPDRLQKETLAPMASRLTVNGDRLTVVQPDGKTREMSLSEFPRSVRWSRAFVPRSPATLRDADAVLYTYAVGHRR